MPNPTNRSARARRASPAEHPSPRQDRSRGRRRAEHVALASRASCGPPRRRARRTRHLAALLLVLLAITFLAPETPALLSDPPPEAPYWQQNAPLAHSNMLRSGYVDVELTRDPIDLLWQNQTDEPLLAGPVLDENRVYTVDRTGKIAAHRLTSGMPVWTHDLEEGVAATPALAYGWLYVATLDGTLYALESQTGTLMGSVDLAGPARAATLATEGRVFQGTDEGVLHVFDAESLTQIWSYSTTTVSYHNGTIDQEDETLKAEIRSPPAVYDGRVFLTAWNGHVYGMSYYANAHGHPEGFWSHEIGDTVKAGPAVSYHEDRLLLPTKEGRIVALDPENGNLIWTSAQSASFISGIALDERQLIARTSDAVLFSLNASSGGKMWSYTDPSGHLSAPILTRDAIVQASGNGTLSLLSRTTGQWLDHPEHGKAHWHLGGAIHAPPAVTRNGIAVADHSGTLSFFGPPVHLNADLQALPISVTGIPFGSEKELELGVHNHGPDPVKEILMRIERSGNLHKERTLDGLDPGESHTIEFLFQAEPGAHELTVTFHPKGATDPDPAQATTQRTLILEDEESLGNENMTAAPPDSDSSPAQGSFGGGLRSGLAWAAGPGTVGGLAAGIFLARLLRGRPLMEKIAGGA